jgi:hypothetical protein
MIADRPGRGLSRRRDPSARLIARTYSLNTGMPERIAIGVVLSRPHRIRGYDC